MGRRLCLGWLVTGLRPFMAGCLPFRRYGPAAFVAERRESETNRAWSPESEIIPSFMARSSIKNIIVTVLHNLL